MAPGNKIRIITRQSPLALLQTEEIMAANMDIDYSVFTIESYGDKNKQISLFSCIPQDFFTRELDKAVLSGKADIAVHSAKDLPVSLKSGLEVIALTKTLDLTDSLVSWNKLTLGKLAKGSKVGTSSISRKSQLLKIRPDLKVVPIRGTIGERLALLDTGDVAALIIATCALKRLGLDSEIAEVLPFETHPLQGSLAVVAKRSRADLKAFFNKIDVRRTYGKVYLIGAGAGSRDLLTLKAVNILEHAGIIFYDDLLDKTLLDNYDCRKVYVGKRKGKHSLPQDEINKLLYQAAKIKQVVVRLKGGDPFIFGRGGEELVYLKDRYIDVEVVPGITAAQAAGASAGVPLTMRGLSNKLTLLSAHNVKDELQGESGTLAYYMGASRLKDIRNTLIKRGLASDTPVALIHKAGFNDEKITLTSLGEIDKKPQESPLIVIAGKTAGLFRQRNKVLFTGIDPYNCFVPGQLIHCPVIEIRPLEFETDINKYDGIVFTSRQAVHVFCERCKITNKHKIVSIGAQTSKALQEYGYRVSYEAGLPDSDVLAELLKRLKLKSVLYPCSNLSDNKIHELDSVEKLVVYETIGREQGKVDLKIFSGIVFSSASTVGPFFKIYKIIPKHLALYVYGKHTARKLIVKGYGKYVQTVSPA